MIWRHYPKKLEPSNSQARESTVGNSSNKIPLLVSDSWQRLKKFSASKRCSITVQQVIASEVLLGKRVNQAIERGTAVSWEHIG